MTEDTIYLFTTGPSCHKCNLTKSRMTKLGMAFEEVDLTKQPEWLQTLQEMGYATAPVVLVPDEDVWNDFRSEDIEYLSRRGPWTMPSSSDSSLLSSS